MESSKECEVLHTLSWDQTAEIPVYYQNNTFDPVCEAILLGSLSQTQSASGSEKSEIVNTLRGIFTDLEQATSVAESYNEFSEVITALNLKIESYSTHVDSRAAKLNNAAGDILQLNLSKTMLVKSLEALKSIVNLLSITNAANEYIKSKNYNTIVFIMLISDKILKYIEKALNNDIYEVFNLYYNNFLNMLKNSIKSDLNAIGLGINLNNEFSKFNVNECGLALGLVDKSLKTEIIANIIDKFLAQYRQCFNKIEDDYTEFLRRINWFKRTLPLVQETTGGYPSAWNITVDFLKEFSIEMSKDLQLFLSNSKSGVNETNFYNLIKICKEFELEQSQLHLNNKIEIKITPKYNLLKYPLDGLDGLELNYVLEGGAPDFTGCLTNAFKDHFNSWLKSQENNLSEFILSLGNDESATTNNNLRIYPSSFELFTMFKSILDTSLSLGGDEITTNVFQIFKKYIGVYHQLLVNRFGLAKAKMFGDLCDDSGTLIGTSLYCENIITDIDTKVSCGSSDVLTLFSNFRSTIISFLIDRLHLSINLEELYFNKIIAFKAVTDNFIMDIIIKFDYSIGKCRDSLPRSCFEYISNKAIRLILKDFNTGICNQIGHGLINSTIYEQINSDLVLLDKYLIGLHKEHSLNQLLLNSISQGIDELKASVKSIYW